MSTILADIQEAVAEHHGITVKDLRGPSRRRAFAWPRQIAMALSRELTEQSLYQVGMSLGDRDHTTIMYGIEAVKARMARDEIEREVYRRIREVLVAQILTFHRQGSITPIFKSRRVK